MIEAKISLYARFAIFAIFRLQKAAHRAIPLTCNRQHQGQEIGTLVERDVAARAMRAAVQHGQRQAVGDTATAIRSKGITQSVRVKATDP